MAGLFPGVCNTQNIDRNGLPLAQAVLTVYQGGTLLLANCYQDIGLAVPAANPMTADLTGRLPIFYVADGVYRVTLNDQYGAKIYDFPQIAAIGPATSGGGGSSVDPTTIFNTGDVLWLDQQGARVGWVRDNGRTIGSATSGASERANVDCQGLFLFGWAKGWSVVGGAGISAAADWAANKQITLPDKRGYVPGGLDDMGNAPAGRFAGVPIISGDAVTPGSVLGEVLHTLLPAEAAKLTYNLTVNEPTHDHAINQMVGGGGNAANANNTFGPGGGLSGRTDPTKIGISVAISDNAGGGSHNNVQKTVLGTFYRKL